MVLINLLQQVFKRKVKHIGLDIGSSLIKLVEVTGEPEDGHYQVIRYGIESLPLGSYNDGLIKNSKTVGQAIINLMQETGTSKKSTVNLGISGKGIIIRQLQMPQMPLAELEQAIFFEAEKYITAPMEQLFIDYTILGEAEVNGNLVYNLLVAAAPRKNVHDLCEIVTSSGLEPLAVDVEPLALFRMWRTNYFDEKLPNQAIVNIGHSNSHLVVFRDGFIHFNRIIPTAGSQLTEAIAQSQNKEVAAAEENKRSGKLVFLSRSQEQEETGDEDNTRFTETINSTLLGLTSEIQRSIDFYQMQAKVRLNRLVITGGTASLQGLDTFLEGQLGLPVLVGCYEQLDPIYSLVSGLALRELMPV